MNLIPYIHFQGEAEEALHFYQEAFGGEIPSLNRWSESPMPVAESDRNRVMHGRLVFGANTIMASDACGRALRQGDNVALSINIDADEAAAHKVFAALSVGGTVTMPLAKTFWGALFGMLVDRFGIHWMINCQLPASA